MTGLLRTVLLGGAPLSSDDAEIEMVRRLVTSVLPFDPHPCLEVGMEVEVVLPLQGARGVPSRRLASTGPSILPCQSDGLGLTARQPASPMRAKWCE